MSVSHRPCRSAPDRPPWRTHRPPPADVAATRVASRAASGAATTVPVGEAGQQQARRISAHATEPAEIERHQQQHGKSRQVQRGVSGVQQREVDIAKEPQVDDRAWRATFLRDEADGGERYMRPRQVSTRDALCCNWLSASSIALIANTSSSAPNAHRNVSRWVGRVSRGSSQPSAKAASANGDAEPEHGRPVDQRHQQSGDQRTERTTERR